MKQKLAANSGVETDPLYSVDDFRNEESIGLLISMVRTQLMATFDNELADLGLTGAQLPVLYWIKQTPEATAATLCRLICTDTGSMTRMLNRLEEKGFVRRFRSQADRRVIHLELTAAGKALWPMITPRVVKILNRFLTGFKRSELEELKSLLRRILANV